MWPAPMSEYRADAVPHFADGCGALSGELADVDELLDDERFVAPFHGFFDPWEGGRRSRSRPICG
jgi:hypothetical protein